MDKKAKIPVFVSHASKDGWIAKHVARDFKEIGRAFGIKVKTFLDTKDIGVGEQITKAILKSIRKCSIFVVIMTPFSIKRKWVWAEIGAAGGLEKQIIPILVYINPSRMPALIGDFKAIELNELENFLAQLFGDMV
jgi:hypothetical protein